MRILCLVGLVLLGLMAAVVPAHAQDTPELGNAVGRAGVGFYTLDTWGLLGASAENPSSVERRPLYTVAADNARRFEFARELWLPPRSRLRFTLPYRLVRPPEGDKAGLEMTAQLLDQVSGRLSTIDADKGMLNIRELPFENAVLAGSSTGSDESASLAGGLRAAAGMKPTSAYLNSASVPTMAQGWDAIDAVVLADPEANFSAAQFEALRRWVVTGGRLWIQLDRTDPAFARRLLGEDWNVSVIDRIGLTEFTLEGVAEDTSSQEVASDYPIDLVRTIAPDMEVIHRVGEYPASLRKRVGRGHLLVTTLQPRAWLTGDDANPETPALSDLVYFTRPTDGRTTGELAAAQASSLGRVTASQIGYSVMSRVPVVAVLAVFAAALLLGGLFLAQRERLAQLGWIAPLMAVVAAAIILGLGLSRQSQTPFTLATSQLIEPLPGTSYARVESVLGVYTPPGAPTGDAVIRGSGPVAWPDLQTHGGENIRLVWQGEDQWRFDGLTLSEGAVQQAHRVTVMPLESPMVARVRFGGEGLVGEVIAPGIEALEHRVIATPAGKLTVNDQPGSPSAFTAPAVDPLAPDTYFGGSLLGQREIDRQAVYRELAAAPGFPTQPMLLGWTTGVESGVAVSDAAQRVQSALVAVPIVIEQPEAGARVAVPDAFLPMSRYRGDQFQQGAPIYDEQNRSWVDNISQPSTVLMQFTLPEALRPLTVDGGRVLLELRAPGRPFEVLSVRDGQLATVIASTNAAGLQTIEFTPENAPTMLDNGTIVIGIRVGSPLDPTKAEPWEVSRFDVDVAGTFGRGGATAETRQAPQSPIRTDAPETP